MRALKVYEIKKDSTSTLSTLGIGNTISLFGKNLIGRMDPDGKVKRIPMSDFVTMISNNTSKEFGDDMADFINSMTGPEDKIIMVPTHDIAGFSDDKDLSVFYDVIGSIDWTHSSPLTFITKDGKYKKTAHASIKYEKLRRIGRMIVQIMSDRVLDNGILPLPDMDYYDLVMYSE